MSEKNDAFHRLARKRTDDILDKLRVLSNLSGPSYEWTPDEVKAYCREVEAGIAQAIDRFAETKRWGDAPKSLDGTSPPPAPMAAEPLGAADDEGDEPEIPIVDEPTRPDAVAREKARLKSIAELMKSAPSELHELAETVVMQREVIQSLQTTLDELRGS